MIQFVWVLLLLVGVVVWFRDRREPFDTKKITDFFELVDPYMQEQNRTFLGLKKS
jgi:hypothetical protein